MSIIDWMAQITRNRPLGPAHTGPLWNRPIPTQASPEDVLRAFCWRHREPIKADRDLVETALTLMNERRQFWMKNGAYEPHFVRAIMEKRGDDAHEIAELLKRLPLEPEGEFPYLCPIRPLRVLVEMYEAGTKVPFGEHEVE